MSYADYESGRLAREEAASPLAAALLEQIPGIGQTEAKRVARALLDKRVVVTMRAYEHEVEQRNAVFTTLNAFRRLLNES